ncbi:hypothetical protein JW921_07840 [Candidatus Fermentibacterales bacterium]|nr:hypothetical protein [Candidatus Fermentibacterales bacterium]
MSRYRRASEMASAFAAVVKDIHSDLNGEEPDFLNDTAALEDLQALIARIILLERDLSDLIDTAVSIEDSLRDRPYEILDFSSEWEGF